MRGKLRRIERATRKAGVVEGATWAMLEGFGVLVCGKGSEKRSVLVVRELHVFSQADAKALAKQCRRKVLPHTSRIVKSRPTFDGTPKKTRAPRGIASRIDEGQGWT